jgi:multiple antibiotic resistance protein
MTFATEILAYVLSTFGALIPIVNPFAAAPMVVSMTGSLTDTERLDQVRRACIYMFCILAAFLVAGGLIMQFLGISIPGLRVAGGLVIAAVGFRMLFAAQPAGRSATTEPAPKHDIAFTPLAMLTLAGLTAVFCYFVLRGATRLSKYLGPSGMSGMTGIMGFPVVCIGVQFVINGVTNLVGGFGP